MKLTPNHYGTDKGGAAFFKRVKKTRIKKEMRKKTRRKQRAKK